MTLHRLSPNTDPFNNDVATRTDGRLQLNATGRRTRDVLIPKSEGKAFHQTYPMLLGYVAGKLGGIGDVSDELSLRGQPLEQWRAARDALFENRHLIDAFCRERGADLPSDVTAQIRAWRHAVASNFVIERDLKKYTVFLDMKDPPTAYGVFGLTQEIVEIIPFGPPIMVETVLLPWKDLIVCDGLMALYNMTMGGGMKRLLRSSYNTAKARGLVTSLDPDHPASTPQPRPKPKTPAIRRFLRRCPRTVDAFRAEYGEPRMNMGGNAAQEYRTWTIDGDPAFDADYVMIYANIIRHQVLYVYAKDGAITHVSVVDQTDWRPQDRRPPQGRRLLT